MARRGTSLTSIYVLSVGEHVQLGKVTNFSYNSFLSIIREAVEPGLVLGTEVAEARHLLIFELHDVAWFLRPIIRDLILGFFDGRHDVELSIGGDVRIQVARNDLEVDRMCLKPPDDAFLSIVNNCATRASNHDGISQLDIRSHAARAKR